MGIGFEQALGIHDDALRFRSQRAGVLANNLANMDTPNYKARDMDFKAAMARANEASSTIQLKTTHNGHHQADGLLDGAGDELYRVPTQPSIDGNTVEEHVEHAKHMENALQFQATFTFLNSKFKGLTSALRGE
ncbi:MAG: flagellar basal body rod protein FlgB [Cellvibrionaceae bacterium]|nr:flagellar basal body rod protein FlgB [Cellvibrionaceae bacterium]|tara:strand:- start:3785 stop:4186 length:402 start_codon:yes stop_codon:yes gene_type:complete